MTFNQLIASLRAKLEAQDPELVREVRAGWDATSTSIEGDLTARLAERVLALLATFEVADKRDAYNELAEAEGLGPLDEGNEDFDYWIHDALLDPVIEALVRQ